MEKHCFMCNALLTVANRSKEHILLNSAGGRLKSCDVLCSTCNHEMGEKPDNELALQLQPMATFLGVKRDNGSNQPYEAVSPDGYKYVIRDGGRPALSDAKVEYDTTNGDLRIKANNINHARGVLCKFKSKHPELSLAIDEILAKAQEKCEYVDDMLTFEYTFGGEPAFRSLVKTALGFYTLCGYDRVHISHLIEYLKGKEARDIVKLYYPDVKPYEVVENEVLNLIHIEGKQSEHTLFAYVEYLGCYQFLMLLSDHYDGEDIDVTYAHDVIAQKQVSKQLNLGMTKDWFDAYKAYSDEFFEIVKNSFGHTLRAGIIKQQYAEIKDIVERKVSEVSKTVIDNDVVNELKECLLQFFWHVLSLPPEDLEKLKTNK